MRKTLAVARKEFRQIWRDTRTLMTLLFVPAFFLLLYGYALNFDIRHVGLGVDDRDRTAESRALSRRSSTRATSTWSRASTAPSPRPTRSGPARSRRALSPPRTIDGLMDRNEVRAVLVIPPGLGRALQTGRRSRPFQRGCRGRLSSSAPW